MRALVGKSRVAIICSLIRDIYFIGFIGAMCECVNICIAVLLAFPAAHCSNHVGAESERSKDAAACCVNRFIFGRPGCIVEISAYIEYLGE